MIFFDAMQRNFFYVGLNSIQIEADYSLPEKTALLFGRNLRRSGGVTYFESAIVRVPPSAEHAWIAALKKAQQQRAEYVAKQVAPREVAPPTTWYEREVMTSLGN